MFPQAKYINPDFHINKRHLNTNKKIIPQYYILFIIILKQKILYFISPGQMEIFFALKIIQCIIHCPVREQKNNTQQGEQN